MSYCLNPKCKEPSNPKNANRLCCINCGAELILQQRYRVIRRLGKGGCGEIFEIDDNGKRKVLKRLFHKDKKLIALFEQEAKVLSKLRHPGIPKVESDGYFQYQIDGSKNAIHCLVMEKIEGLNLSEWLEKQNHQPISEKKAIAWLHQLIEILEKLHQEQYFHRDIKPTNIMLRKSGQLVLIDFGTVRKITDTYLAKLGGNQELVTAVLSYGYTPLEQINGKPLPQSDFFALGRTFVYLLTGKEPSEFDEDEHLRLLWRESAINISQPLADLIDWLMEPSRFQRPINTDIIRQYLQALESGSLHQLQEFKKLSLQKQKRYFSAFTTFFELPKLQLNWKIFMLSSLTVTGLIMGVRYLGWLQNWELSAFDWLMRSRPGEVIDSRLLVIEITEEDIKKYVGDRYKKYSIRDATLAKVIEKLQKYQPRLIGLDLHRYQPRPPGRKEFIEQLQKNKNILLVCFSQASINQYKDFLPLPELQHQIQEKFGFSDLENNDPDKYVRRQILHFDSDLNPYISNCTTPYSLSFYLAKRFLEIEGITLKLNQNEEWQTEKVVLKKLATRTGGYQNLDGKSNQILINYRSPWGQEKIAKSLSLTQLLEAETDSQLKELVNNKIVLVGYTAPIAKDDFNTPYGRIPGVWVHAHQLSQIISAIIDNRPLLWVLPQWGNFQWGDFIWVAIWSLIGSLLVWKPRYIYILFFFNSLAILLLYQIALTTLTYGGWLPFVPSVLSLFSTQGLIIYISYRKTHF
ncbi:CHASE2 domain-containing protein [Floridanema aerugineum]|uniref:non-specific serine/threonine protein kinase n=1 Tax=Floridaenema aerugineum BLCC-F46 TaxID=3153654 RepID=A0ABV4X2K8_9CYAN